jgi:hypothetical protein
MDERMPPPPGRGSLQQWERAVESPVAARRSRPVAVTIAGALLIVAGAFAALASALILLVGDGATIEGIGGDTPAVAVVVSLVLASAEILAGVLVLRCLPVGRTLGSVVGALGILSGLATIRSPQGLVAVAIFGFVVYALVTNADAFRRTPGE